MTDLMSTRICPTCKQEVEVKVGLNADNMKKLFSWPTTQEWIQLAILLLVFFLAFSYKAETQACRDMLEELETENILDRVIDYNPEINIPNLTIYNDDTTKINSVPTPS